jgi:hypothetical protein
MSLKDSKLKEVFLLYVSKNRMVKIAISGICRTSGVPEFVFSSEWNSIPCLYHGISTKFMDRPNQLICYLIVQFPLQHYVLFITTYITYILKKKPNKTPIING